MKPFQTALLVWLSFLMEVNDIFSYTLKKVWEWRGFSSTADSGGVLITEGTTVKWHILKMQCVILSTVTLIQTHQTII